MRILVYPDNPDAFDAEEVECERWNRIDPFTIGIAYYPDLEEGTQKIQTWQSEDCPMHVKVLDEV